VLLAAAVGQVARGVAIIAAVASAAVLSIALERVREVDVFGVAAARAFRGRARIESSRESGRFEFQNSSTDVVSSCVFEVTVEEMTEGCSF
jgi:hypothetical protein